MRTAFGYMRRRVWPETASDAISSLARSLTRRGNAPLICGPFLGEPGYETLYWIPFLKNLASPLLSEGHEVVVISRGGVEQLYADLLARGATYVDVLDVLTVEDFVSIEKERVLDPRAKNQKQASDFDARILNEAGYSGARALLPSHMFTLLARYPHSSVCDWTTWPESADGNREELTLIKLWFGGQLPGVEQNIRLLERWIERFASQGPVAAIANQHSLEANPAVDQPFEDLVDRLGIPTMSTRSPRTNLGDQVEMVSRSTRFVSTYGGLAYLSLYTNTPLVSFYTEPKIVFSQHFWNFATAVAHRNVKGREGRLSVSLIDLQST